MTLRIGCSGSGGPQSWARLSSKPASGPLSSSGSMEAMTLAAKMKRSIYADALCRLQQIQGIPRPAKPHDVPEKDHDVAGADLSRLESASRDYYGFVVWDAVAAAGSRGRSLQSANRTPKAYMREQSSLDEHHLVSSSVISYVYPTARSS